MHVAAHQIVEAAELGVDGLIPLLAFEELRSVALRDFIPVDVVEARPVLREIRIRARTPREREAGPCPNRLGPPDDPVVVLGVDRGDSHDPGRVGAHMVVEDDVDARGDSRLVQGLGGT